MNQPFRLVISNQRGGVAKTTTAIALASILADADKKVLLIDTDPQGSIHSILGYRPQHDFYDALIQKFVFEDCLFEVRSNLFVLASTRKTTEAEGLISNFTARELTFANFFPEQEAKLGFDAVIVDCAPSISLLQSCAMMYCKQVLVPVAMEPLSLQGAGASIYTVSTLNHLFKPTEPVRVLGLLPVIVNKRLAITQTIMTALAEAADRFGTPVLPQIRTDQAVIRAVRDKRFLLDDPTCKALEDYRAALKVLLGISEDIHAGSTDEPEDAITTEA